MIRTNLHNANLFIKAWLWIFTFSAKLIFSNFFVTSSWNKVWNKSHILWQLHWVFTETTIFKTKRLSFSVWVPVIMRLIMSVVLIERIIQVTINPIELWDMTKVEWHLRIIIGCIFVSCSNRVQSLIEIWMNNFVAQVIVTLLPVVIWHVWRVKIDSCHI